MTESRPDGHPARPAHLREPGEQPGLRARSSGMPSQLLARELNEQIVARRTGSSGNDREIEIVCECDHRTCSKPVRISLSGYETVRRFPTRFVIDPAHVAAGDERVVAREKTFVVVEKSGGSAAVAIRLDPRKRRSGVRPAA